MNTVDFTLQVVHLERRNSTFCQAIELVTAANSTNKKNTTPIAVPNPMFVQNFRDCDKH